jgi:hypothetical protein
VPGDEPTIHDLMDFINIRIVQDREGDWREREKTVRMHWPRRVINESSRTVWVCRICETRSPCTPLRVEVAHYKSHPDYELAWRP